jgi:isochorismate synthase
LSDFITYRFPGKEIVKKNGFFEEILPSKIVSGFVVTNLDFSKCYLFREDESEAIGFHFSQAEPYVMSAREYYLQAHELLNGLNQFQMEKAVFSRIKSFAFDEDLVQNLFDELEANYKNAFTYLISSEKLGTWIGASPEILLEVHSDFMFTTALAGTKKNDEIDQEWGEKEFFEQQIVTDYLLEKLTKLKLKGIETQGPYDFTAGPVTHLKTDISADLNNVLPWEIAQEIHPTPAIGGYPKLEAINLIHAIEPHNRELYTGVIGLIDEKTSRLYVNLRCAQVQKDKIYLYLGGGFTKQSIPDLEWLETENKSKTLLNYVKKVLAEK